MPVNAERIRKLMDHGLTEYQARVYLALLDLDTATASQVTPHARVPRTRIYATMSQLHEKGLVDIIPETPLRYKAVPFARYMEKTVEELRDRAAGLERNLEASAKEFAVLGQIAPEEKGRFEAIYGRRNVRERLIKMYESAEKSWIGIGTMRSPGRVMRGFGEQIIEKSENGVRFRYAFPVTQENLKDVERLARYAELRSVDFYVPMYMHVADARQFIMSHPIPDDDSFYRGDDICIWTDDRALAQALANIMERIWEGAKKVDVPVEGR
ncbi:MAG: TrmB family transcriptional regulator [Euryarchaeota archaeon]|nr:TrmB family transcriptional regulator [Euryarchaeota archaeon]